MDIWHSLIVIPGKEPKMSDGWSDGHLKADSSKKKKKSLLPSLHSILEVPALVTLLCKKCWQLIICEMLVRTLEQQAIIVNYKRKNTNDQ